MNARTIATLAVAVLLGVIAVVLVQGYISSARNTPAPQAAQTSAGVPVVVAAKPIDRGVALTADLLKVVNYPADAAPPTDFQTLAQLTGPGQTGRLALRSLALNEPVLSDKISGPGGKLTLATTVAVGMRAVSLRSSDVAGVAGFVLPGDHVDILLTRTISGGDQGGDTVTQVLAQDVLVLGVDQSDNDEADKPVVARAVTVQVTPEQAEAISLAQAVGSVSFALRHVADDAALTRRSMTVADLGFAPRRAAPAAGDAGAHPRRAPGTIDVRVTRGVQTTGYSVGYW
ncbi:MAG TPA: Flp pilus assembly protein CpaB [Caulobacteraceae bacterium]|nr:Flp pilus assembly protein CpaB [Caulobacteraceae bacterium]